MSNLLLLILCFAAGVLMRRTQRMPESAPATINSFIVHVSFPALTLLYVHDSDFQFGKDIILIAIMPWIYFVLAAAFFWYVGRRLQWSRGTVGALILTGGLGNTSFFGLPMIEAFYGQEGLASGIIIDQLGSFLVLSTLGLTVAGIYSAGRPGLTEIVRRIVTYPPFIALVVAALLRPVEYAPWFSEFLMRLGDTLAPLALFAVGYQLRLGHLQAHGRNLIIGLGFKLLLAPLLIYLLYVQFLDGQGLSMQVTVFEAAMPPMITAAILAAEHDLDPELATLMVAVGLMVSFVTLSCWWFLLRGV